MNSESVLVLEASMIEGSVALVSVEDPSLSEGAIHLDVRGPFNVPPCEIESFLFHLQPFLLCRFPIAIANIWPGIVVHRF